jgi:hypothetical protein
MRKRQKSHATGKMGEGEISAFSLALKYKTPSLKKNDRVDFGVWSKSVMLITKNRQFDRRCWPIVFERAIHSA